MGAANNIHDFVGVSYSAADIDQFNELQVQLLF